MIRRVLSVLVVFTALTVTPVSAAVPPTAFGISVDSADDAGRFANTAGRQIGAARVFLHQIPAQWNGSDLLSVPADATVAFSFTSGTAAEVTAFEQSRPRGQACTATFWHEPENDSQWRSAAGQAAYRSRWDYYAPAIRAGGCRPMLILMRYTLNSPGGMDWHSWYSAKSVDILGWDGYNPGRKQNPALYSDPAIIVDKMAAAAAGQGKPWAIGETGSPILRTSDERARWVAALAQRASAKGALFVCWWDQYDPQSGFNNQLDSAAARNWHA